MAVQLQPVGGQKPPRAFPRKGRKVGLLGSHTASLADCPWDDPSWELWGHASSRAWYQRELDRYFDIHNEARWTQSEKKGSIYLNWLKNNTVPIYMQKRDGRVPASVTYPKGRALQEFRTGGRNYFGNTTAWMIALALMEGVERIGLWGINYSSESEWGVQRGSAEYWLGICEGRDVDVILPEQCSLLQEPSLLYGYESHDENGVLVEEYRRKEFKGADTIKIRPDGSGPKAIDSHREGHSGRNGRRGRKGPARMGRMKGKA